MRAEIKAVLCIGENAIFSAYDNVELILKNGRMVKGRILPMNNTRSFYLDTPKCVELIYLEDIKECARV